MHVRRVLAGRWLVKGDAMSGCPVCGRDTATEFGRIAFHYARSAEPLRVCLAVDVRHDDWHALAVLQVAHRAAAGVDRVSEMALRAVVALDRLTAMVAAAAPTLERVAVAIEARTAVAKAAEARAAKSAAEYLDALMRATSDDDSGPVPAPVDDSADDGSH